MSIESLRQQAAATRAENANPTPGRWRKAPPNVYENAVWVLGEPHNGILICRTPRGGSVYHTILIRWRGTTIHHEQVSLWREEDLQQRAVSIARDIVTRVGWYLGDAAEDGCRDHEEGLAQ